MNVLFNQVLTRELGTLQNDFKSSQKFKLVAIYCSRKNCSRNLNPSSLSCSRILIKERWMIDGRPFSLK